MIDIDKIFKNMRRRSGAILYNQVETNFRPYAFVLNVEQLIGADCIELAPGYTLRRARKAEVGHIKDFLSTQLGSVASTSIWESLPIASGKQPKLPKKLWRYFVIEFGTEDPNLDLLKLHLQPPPLALT